MKGAATCVSSLNGQLIINYTKPQVDLGIVIVWKARSSSPNRPYGVVCLLTSLPANIRFVTSVAKCPLDHAYKYPNAFS
jgi:hypothetical protein